VSPFADALRNLRFKLGLRQQALADLVGCDRSYLSALENDLKHAPSAAFVQTLGAALKLSDADVAGLQRARERSQRAYVVPADTPMQAYDFVYELFACLEGLNSLQVQAMRAVLELGGAPRSASMAVEGRIRRIDRRPKEQEEAM
jgi:transcriptional regulator with XRE-family HTH domain